MTRTITYTCPYVPAEWIAAHNLIPNRIIPSAAGSSIAIGRTEGICPFVRSFVYALLNNNKTAGIVVTTVCDQMRRACDLITRRTSTPVFLMNIPKTFQYHASYNLYRDELNRLGKFLTQVGGRSPSGSKLAEVMLRYNKKRSSLPAIREYLTPRQYSETLAAFNRNYDLPIPENINDKKNIANGIPLAIIGGPLLKEGFDIFDVVEDSGGRIVLDATETGERGMCKKFDHRQLNMNPFNTLADAYFNHIPDASRRPNNQLYDWFRDKVTSRSVHGIIFLHYIWCDTWHAEFYRLKQSTTLRVLDIELSGEETIVPKQTVQRIQSFLETLR